MRSRLAALAFLCASAVAGPAPEGAAEKARALLARLGDESFQAREKASAAIETLGVEHPAEVLECLSDACGPARHPSGEDLEMVARIRELRVRIVRKAPLRMAGNELQRRRFEALFEGSLSGASYAAAIEDFAGTARKGGRALEAAWILAAFFDREPGDGPHAVLLALRLVDPEPNPWLHLLFLRDSADRGITALRMMKLDGYHAWPEEEMKNLFSEDVAVRSQALREMLCYGFRRDPIQAHPDGLIRKGTWKDLMPALLKREDPLFRNGAVAAAWVLEDPSMREPLAALLDHKDPAIREHAAVALGAFFWPRDLKPGIRLPSGEAAVEAARKWWRERK